MADESRKKIKLVNNKTKLVSEEKKKATFFNKIKTPKGIVIASLIVLFFLLFVVNHFGVFINMPQGKEIVANYGEEFDDGVTARFGGSLLFKNIAAVDVSKSGTVDTLKYGTYEIQYSAKKGIFSNNVKGTVTVRDIKGPDITLLTQDGYYTLPGQQYVEEGYTAIDNHDGDVTDRVVREERDGKVYYSATDDAGNTTTVVREIVYSDPVAPEITFNGSEDMSVVVGGTFTDPGVTAIDNLDGDVTDKVTSEGSVDTSKTGTYKITYKVSDAAGNEATAVRTVLVREKDAQATGDKIVYLTFDDGPGPYTQQLLDVLSKYNVKVTFFVINSEYKDLIAKEAAAGHTVAMHTASHDYAKIYASKDAYFSDLYEIQNVIKQETGKDVKMLRFPGGSSNGVSAKYCSGLMTELVTAVREQGYQYYDWNISSGDAGGTTSSDEVYQNVISGMQKNSVSVVLQHDIKKFSVDAVERIIQWGLNNGYTFKALSPDSYAAHHSRLNN